MTKYILVGGYPKRAQDGGKALAEEMVKGFTEPVRFLVCYFARPEDQWEANFTDDKEFFAKELPGTSIEFKIATVKDFIEQLQWANVLYIRGGSMEPLYERLGKNPGWEKNLDGKTVAGSSAGAHALTKYNHKLDTPEIGEGLGLLPVKVLVHYRSDYNAPNIDWDAAYEQLKVYKEDLPLYTLAEGEFVIL